MISAKDYLARLDQAEKEQAKHGRGYKGTKLPYLRAWRRQCCLSQLMLADFAGLSATCISLLEHCHYGASPSTIHRLAEVLRITPKQLVEQEPPKPQMTDRSTVALPHLRAWRARAYLSQVMLAEKAGLGDDTIKALERGREKAQTGTLHALARALGITPQQLIEGPHDL